MSGPGGVLAVQWDGPGAGRPAERCQPAHATASDGEGCTGPILPRENMQCTENTSSQLTRNKPLIFHMQFRRY